MANENIESFLFVIFGGTGDLMSRKILPALCQILERHGSNSTIKILAVARGESLNDEAYQEWAENALVDIGVALNTKTKEWLSESLHYQTIRSGSDQDYSTLRSRIEEIEAESGLAENRLIYLALPPSAVTGVARGLGKVGLNKSGGWTRLVVEKPFGYDLESATDLNKHLHLFFDESQIYRIDHYLGKETVQNLLVFRFANPIFESVWNRDRVESVHILVSEELGVGTRAGYYDRSGAIRDMIQNHLAQLLCLTAMEVPVAFEADAIRDEKVKVLRSIIPIDPTQAVLGQYAGSGQDASGTLGYLQEKGVPPDSKTETFAALKLKIANWRWQGVPFYLTTGKRLKERLTRITVRFRCPPVQLFETDRLCHIASNELVITLQPGEGFDLGFEVKAPGDEIKMETQRLNFRYAEAFGSLPEAYETLLLDVVRGDQTLFVRADETEASWRLFSPLLSQKLPIHEYVPGSWGAEA